MSILQSAEHPELKVVVVVDVVMHDYVKNIGPDTCSSTTALFEIGISEKFKSRHFIRFIAGELLYIRSHPHRNVDVAGAYSINSSPSLIFH